MHARFRTPVLAIVVATLLSGCVTGGANNSMGQRSTDLDADFLSGRIRLDCGFSCSGAWGANRQQANVFYAAERWDLLADQVLRIGFGSDITYFYLGRAAEGLGKIEAAENYYTLGQASKIHCDSLVNNCDGLDIPKSIGQRLRALKVDASPAQERASLSAAPLQHKAPAPLPVNSAPAVSGTDKHAAPISSTAATTARAASPANTAKTKLTEVLDDAVQGGRISSGFCRSARDVASDLFSVRGYAILANNATEDVGGGSGPRAMYMVRIDSSTKGGIPVTQNWYVVLETEMAPDSAHWCLTALVQTAKVR